MTLIVSQRLPAKTYVLLSTFNGAVYVGELLESVVKQDYGNLTVIARDDGSTDETCGILKAYAAKHKNIIVVEGMNLGVVGSFFELMKLCPDDAKYAAFCDQDDVWLTDKISQGVKKLSELNRGIPALYFSRLLMVDSELRRIALSDRPRRTASFENALVQNIATGCSIVINKEALDLVVKNVPNISRLRMHDWWIYQTISAFGKVVYDEEARIFYRQHDKNVVGASTGFQRWRAKYKRFVRRGHSLYLRQQLTEFRAAYDKMLPHDKRRLIDEILEISHAGVMSRVGYALRTEVYRQKFLDNFIFKILVILNKM